MGSNIILRKIYVEVDQKKKRYKDIKLIKYQKVSSSTRFIPLVYHDWKNMEIHEFNFLLTK